MGTIGQFLTGGAVLGLITAIIQYFLTRPKVRAEAAKTATEAAGLAQGQLRDIIADLNRRIDQQDVRIEKLDKENDKLEAANDALIAENRRVRDSARAVRESLRQLSQWVARFYDEANPPPGIEPPPKIDDSRWPNLDDAPPTPNGDLR